MPDWVVYLLAGASGGLLLEYLQVPAGMVTGSMLAVALVKVIVYRSGQPLFARRAPKWFNEVGSALLGTAIGSTFTRSALVRLGGLLVPFLIGVGIMISVGIATGVLFSRITGTDLATGLFSLTPGGIAEMTSMCQELGADQPVVATIQFIRLATVLAISPPFVGWLSGLLTSRAAGLIR